MAGGGGRRALAAPLMSWWSAESRGGTRRLRTRRTLLLAAACEIDAVGYHKASLRGILESAQLTKGALYFHFESKEDLARAVVVEAMSSWREVVEAVQGLGLDPLWTQIMEVDASVGRRMHDPPARAAGRIIAATDLFETLRAQWMEDWATTTATSMVRAAETGILRDQVEPRHLARSVMALTSGHFVLADLQQEAGDYFARMNDMWEGLLPVVTTRQWYDDFTESGWLGRPAPELRAYLEARLL